MSDIRSIITDEPAETHIVASLTRDDYVTCVGMNPGSLAAGLVGHDDINPTAIRMAWESPDDTPRTIAQQDSLDRGTLAHLFVLQPELVMKRVAEWEGGKRIGKDYDQFVEDNPGKLLIRSNDFNEVAKATNAMRSVPEVSNLIYGIDCEVAMFGSIPCPALDGHILIKGQVDAVRHSRHTIVDLKTTEAGIDRRSVDRTIKRFHYREKMGMYRRWMATATDTQPEAWQCYNVFMSLTPPYGVVVAKFTDFTLEWGEQRMTAALESVQKCLVANEWPMYCREMFVGVEEWEMEEEIEYGQ